MKYESHLCVVAVSLCEGRPLTGWIAIGAPPISCYLFWDLGNEREKNLCSNGGGQVLVQLEAVMNPRKKVPPGLGPALYSSCETDVFVVTGRPVQYRPCFVFLNLFEGPGLLGTGILMDHISLK